MSGITPSRGPIGSASLRGHESHHGTGSASASGGLTAETSTRSAVASPELKQALAEVKGQAQFVLYLADQIEESLEQLSGDVDSCHGAFLCKILGMYSSQLESKHQGLGDRIAETCQEVYVTVREYDAV